MSAPDTLDTLRSASEERLKVRLRYRDLKDRVSESTVRPLEVFEWNSVWTLAAWCETGDRFRNFRVDRIESLEVSEERFRDEPGRTLADLARAVDDEMDERDRSTDA